MWSIRPDLSVFEGLHDHCVTINLVCVPFFLTPFTSDKQSNEKVTAHVTCSIDWFWWMIYTFLLNFLHTLCCFKRHAEERCGTWRMLGHFYLLATISTFPSSLHPPLFHNVFDLHSSATSQSEQDQILLIHKPLLPVSPLFWAELHNVLLAVMCSLRAVMRLLWISIYSHRQNDLAFMLIFLL